MSTRASVVIYDENDVPLVEMYKHWDGYLEGFGKELQEFSHDYKIINGISGQTMQDKYANGMGDFAAQLIGHFKTSIGDTSIIPIGQDWGQEHHYTIKPIKQGRELGQESGVTVTHKDV